MDEQLEQGEVLVLLCAAPAEQQRAAARRLRAAYPVVSALGERLLVLRGGAAACRAIGAQAGVQRAVTGPCPVPDLPVLTEAEALFVAAWGAQGRKSGPRPGDGLGWQAPGFEPPGGPRRS